ncbi:MAG: hypothetical protein JWM11_2749 [Planctomycetaceae bacterium]|nr:hypothetical protein [Planctomycetaceae bacterium]
MFGQLACVGAVRSIALSRVGIDPLLSFDDIPPAPPNFLSSFADQAVLEIKCGNSGDFEIDQK